MLLTISAGDFWLREERKKERKSISLRVLNGSGGDFGPGNTGEKDFKEHLTLVFVPLCSEQPIRLYAIG